MSNPASLPLTTSTEHRHLAPEHSVIVQRRTSATGWIDFIAANRVSFPGSGEVADAPVVRYVQTLLEQSVARNASDLHIEPQEHLLRVRFRIDGQLHEVSQPPLELRDQLATRIKVLSRLDIAERRLPQDGRMKLSFETPEGHRREIDFRVSTLPTLFGEKIVVRVLQNHPSSLELDTLGYEPEQRRLIEGALLSPHGMVLLTGPTGSGKTLSLYTFLKQLNNGRLNICTAEDPAEIHLPGINQVNINERVGLDFAATLRAFMRQDPDVIMVGEIRDAETADIAVKAAQTGHLVFSTLHTNDAPSTLSRLMNMGVAPYNVASSLLLVGAQRLVRRLCPDCAEPADLASVPLREAGFTADELDGHWRPLRAVGCANCHDGYRGRIALHEVMAIDETLQSLIHAHASSAELAAQARRGGMLPLRMAGLRKVRRGLTTLDEVFAATPAL